MEICRNNDKITHNRTFCHVENQPPHANHPNRTSILINPFYGKQLPFYYIYSIIYSKFSHWTKSSFWQVCPLREKRDCSTKMGQFWPSSLMGTSSMDVSSTWAQQRNMAGELGWAKGLAVRRLGKAALWKLC